MDDGKPLSEVLADSQAPAVVANTVVAPPVEEEKKISKTKEKKMARERQRLQVSFGKMVEKFSRKQQQTKVQMERLKERVGKKEFALLKTLATVATPEKKDEKGEVIQKATSHLNHELLFQEGQNLITILRESRMKSGKRKRTTGRSSKRKAHRSRLNAIIERNKVLEALSKPKTEAAVPAGNSSETTQNS